MSEKSKKYMFRHVGGLWVLFSDSLGFFTSIALGFVPKDPLGPDFKPKQNFKKNMKTCLRRAQFGSFGILLVSLLFISCFSCVGESLFVRCLVDVGSICCSKAWSNNGSFWCSLMSFALLANKKL